jgi:hypothetical protein
MKLVALVTALLLSCVNSAFAQNPPAAGAKAFGVLRPKGSPYRDLFVDARDPDIAKHQVANTSPNGTQPCRRTAMSANEIEPKFRRRLPDNDVRFTMRLVDPSECAVAPK